MRWAMILVSPLATALNGGVVCVVVGSHDHPNCRSSASAVTCMRRWEPNGQMLRDVEHLLAFWNSPSRQIPIFAFLEEVDDFFVDDNFRVGLAGSP